MNPGGDTLECRAPGCTREATSSGTHRSRFCSDKCEVRYDHLLDDARDAERAAREGAEQDG